MSAKEPQVSINTHGAAAPGASGSAGRLSDRVAVVTGASSGIGAGVARRFRREGAHVIAVGRDEERLQEVRAGPTGSRGTCTPLVADLAAADGVQLVVRAAVDAHGRIDVLVHSAGVFRVGAFADLGPDVLDEQYLINVRAPYALTHAALPFLSKGSSVVFISSNLAQVGMPGAAGYCASKGAVDALARTLAVDLAPRIRVNTIAPGIVRTPMSSRLQPDNEAGQRALHLTPAGRFGEVEEIAEAAVFVACDAGYMIGATLVIDGGWNAH